MNAHHKNLGTENYPLMAAEHMGSRLLEMHIEALRVSGVWQSMNHEQQHAETERARKAIQKLVAAAVNTISTQGHIAISAQLKSTANDKEIKAVFNVDRDNKHDALVELLMSQAGTRCQILLVSAEDFIGGMDELVFAESDQRELFNEPLTPEDSMPWCINIPVMSGDSIVPCPTRKDAEMYARSIRLRFLEDENEANRDYAKDVYAKPWPETPGSHNRSIAKGNFEAMINWFSKLCRGEISIEPVALIEYVPKAPEPAATSQKDYASLAEIWSEAVKHVQKSKKFSSTGLQRKFSIGNDRAALLADAMEETGIVSLMGPSGKRDVLILEGVPALPVFTPVAIESKPDEQGQGAIEPEGEVVDAEVDPDYVAPTSDKPVIHIEPLTDDDTQDPESFVTPESVQFSEPQPEDLDNEPAPTLKAGLAPEQLAGEIIATVRMKGDQFVAEYLGHESKSKTSSDVALSGLSAKLGLKGNISHKEITSEQDANAQVRRFKIVADQEQ